jgi:hypothetical protein
MKTLTLDQIITKHKHHCERAAYYLSKQRRLPFNAHARRSIAHKNYMYHMAQRAKLLADVTGAPVQMALLP